MPYTKQSAAGAATLDWHTIKSVQGAEAVSSWRRTVARTGRVAELLGVAILVGRRTGGRIVGTPQARSVRSSKDSRRRQKEGKNYGNGIFHDGLERGSNQEGG